MLGGLLALLASATFALSNVTARRGVLTGSVLQALVVTIWLGVPVFVVAILLTGQFGELAAFPLASAVYLSLAGLVHFVLGRYCNYRAIAAIGVNLASPVQESALLVSLALAVWLLGEVLTGLKIFGIVLVLLGPAIILRVSRKNRPATGSTAADAQTGASPIPEFRPRYAEGFLYAGLSALAYGISPILVRAGLSGTSPGIGIAGGLISYVVASVVVAPLVCNATARRDILALRFPAAKWFTVAGVVLCLSQMIRYMALSIAPVTIVTPIQRLSIIFRVLFGWLLNRDHEVFGLGVLAAVAISMIGAVALTLDTEFILSLVPLPSFLAEAAGWRWPHP
jgi:drug/metabolite transporter (DMT)-like permease